MKRLIAFILALFFAFSATAEVLCEDGVAITEDLLVEYGLEYTSKDEVALYLHCFCELPVNYISKNAAKELGWDGNGATLWKILPGMSIGGSYFGNYEELLPVMKGRSYYECDIDFDGTRRNALRIVFSNDGLIYYTGDHYESFELLYDGWYFEDAIYISAE